MEAVEGFVFVPDPSGRQPFVLVKHRPGMRAPRLRVSGEQRRARSAKKLRVERGGMTVCARCGCRWSAMSDSVSCRAIFRTTHDARYTECPECWGEGRAVSNKTIERRCQASTMLAWQKATRAHARG